jgi:hypothetical protein
MEYFVWMTTRKIRAGALDDFERVWQPNPYPEGLARAYALLVRRRPRADWRLLLGLEGIMRRLARIRGREAAPRRNGALRAGGPGSVLPRSRTRHSWPEQVAHHCGMSCGRSSPPHRHSCMLRRRSLGYRLGLSIRRAVTHQLVHSQSLRESLKPEEAVHRPVGRSSWRDGMSLDRVGERAAGMAPPPVLLANRG